MVRKQNKVYTLSMTAVMTAVICVLAPLAVPVGPIPISLTNFVIFLSLYLLGWKLGTVSYLVYVLIGAVGMPVFSGFTGGMGKVFGPTGGYLLGFVPMALIAGAAIAVSDNRVVHMVGMTAGLAVCYTLGTAWFCFESGATLVGALATCVLPFLPGDGVKIGLAGTIGPVLRRRLKQANLLN